MKQKFKVNPDFVIQKIGGKTSLFDAQKSILYSLNDVAALIFLGVQLKWSQEKIIEKITQKYKVDLKIISQDYEQILEDMIKKKILIRS